jgi:hypothetical protein
MTKGAHEDLAAKGKAKFHEPLSIGGRGVAGALCRGVGWIAGPDQRRELFNQSGHVARNDSPGQRQIHTEVPVDQHIAQSGDSPPWNPGMRVTDFPGTCFAASPRIMSRRTIA